MARPRHPTGLGLAVAATVTLAGCFTSTGDFRGDAEDFIVGDDGLSEALDTTFVAADCAEPANRDVGTSFTCTGTDDEGRMWEFDIVITGSSEYEVNLSRRP